MKDPKLDEEINLLSALMAEMKALRDVIAGTLSTEVVIAENETRLNQIKESLPAAAERFYTAVGLPVDPAIERLRSQPEDLTALIRMTELDRHRYLELWHRTYMSQFFIVGKLMRRKELLDALKPMVLTLRRIVLNPIFVIVALLIVALLIFAIL